MKFSHILFRVLIPLGIVVGGGATAFAMINSAGTAEKSEPRADPLLVSVVDPAPEDAVAVISGTGVVEPARRVVISPEVTGRIRSMSDDLVLGGRVDAGDELVRLDARDYQIDVKSQRANVEKARLDLEVEKGRGRVAKREWEMLGKDTDKAEDEGRLVLRKPQEEQAEVAIQVARAGLDRAQLNLSRTRIDAPFNATVVSESIEEGQLVQPGTQMATLIGTDAFWVRVSLPIEDLALIKVPGAKALDGTRLETGSAAQVFVRAAGNVGIERTGEVIRLVGELDPETRRAQVLVRIRDPLDPPDGQLPLLPGAFVDVEIDGENLPGTRRVPRAAIVNGDEVLVADANDQLARRQLTIRWGDEDDVYVSDGLADGDRIIMDKVSPVIVGMALRTRPADESDDGVATETTATSSPEPTAAPDDE